MTNSEVSIEDMWRTLEKHGIKRNLLEKMHPTPETISRIYSSVKKQRQA